MSPQRSYNHCRITLRAVEYEALNNNKYVRGEEKEGEVMSALEIGHAKVPSRAPHNLMNSRCSMHLAVCSAQTFDFQNIVPLLQRGTCIPLQDEETVWRAAEDAFDQNGFLRMAAAVVHPPTRVVVALETGNLHRGNKKAVLPYSTRADGAA